MNIDSGSVKKLSEVAANESTKFDATERSAFIRSHIQHVRRMVVNRQSIDDIKSAFPEFTEQYPSLLEMIMRPTFDEQALTLMITMLDRMGSNNTTQHEASIKVGQHLLNAYVKPQIDGQF